MTCALRHLAGSPSLDSWRITCDPHADAFVVRPPPLSDPYVVIVLSLAFIGSIFFLHISSKVGILSACPTRDSLLPPPPLAMAQRNGAPIDR